MPSIKDRAARLFYAPVSPTLGADGMPTATFPALPKHVITHEMAADRLGALYPLPEGNPGPPYAWLPPSPSAPTVEHYIMPAPPPRSLAKLVEQHRHLFTRGGERYLGYLGSIEGAPESPRDNGYLLVRRTPLKLGDGLPETPAPQSRWTMLSAYELTWVMVLRLKFGWLPNAASGRLPLQCRTSTALPGGPTIKIGWCWVDEFLLIHAIPMPEREKSNPTFAAAVKLTTM